MDAPLGDESGFELEGEGGRNIWQFPYMAPLIAKRHMVLPSTRLFCFRGGGNKELEIPLEYERRLKKHHSGWRGEFWTRIDVHIEFSFAK